MTNQMLGYLVLIVFAIVLTLVATYINRRFQLKNVDELLAAGRKIPFGFVAASVFVAWVWSGTLIGASEAGVWFGISGGLNYGWGAIVPFLVFIPVALRLRKIMPRTTTFVEFIKERFGDRLATLFFIFGVFLVLYVCVMQAVGIAYAFQYTFGLNYKLVAFLSAIIFSSYIAIAGLRGSIYNSLFQFFVIIVIIFVTMPLIIKAIGLGNMYTGLLNATTDTTNVNHNPDALNLLSGAGLRYGISAVVVAMGQVILSQGYYSTAAAASSTRNLLWAYLIGTVLAWLPVPIIFGNVVGSSVFHLGLDSQQLAVSSGAAPYIFEYFLGSYGAIAFVILIFMAGLTTGGNGLAGIQAMFTIDFYKKYFKKTASESEQTSFGKKITIAAGVIIGLCAMLLDGVSLLQIDIFSGILFAAPTAALIVGLWSNRLNTGVAYVSIFAGLVAGLCAYFLIPDDELNYFVGNTLSLGLPFLVILTSLPFSKKSFNFNKLLHYKPEHEIHLD